MNTLNDSVIICETPANDSVIICETPTNDAVIICETPAKSSKKKVPLGMKRERKNTKKSFYESPLRHIELSIKRWRQLQERQKLLSNPKPIVNAKKDSSLLIKDACFQDSIIILSDNESESSKQKDQQDQSNSRKRRKRKRSLEMLIEDNQNSRCLRDSNESLCQGVNEIEIRSKKRKKNSPVLTDTNVSCLLISDTEDSEIVPVDSDENTAPASSSVNQTSDDIIVVWSAKKSSPLSTTCSGGETTSTEETNKLFMIDCSPTLENLKFLEDDKKPTSDKQDKNSEENAKDDTESIIEETNVEKDTEENTDTSDEEDDPKYLPFSKEGLKLPKPNNISKTLRIKKSVRKKSFLEYRKQALQSSLQNRKIPVWCKQAIPEMAKNDPPEVQCGPKLGRPDIGLQYKHECEYRTRCLPSKTNSFEIHPSNDHLCVWHQPPKGNNDTSKDDTSKLEPSRCEPPQLEPSNSESFRHEPSKPDPSKPESSTGLKKLREIIIDGNNVAMAYKNNRMFSEEGIILVMDYFHRRGHTVKVFVPQYRRSRFSPLLECLYREGIVIFTPSRKVGGRSIVPYDDRFILEYATMSGGVVISSDQYRDLYKEKPEWRDTIENRLLPPTFVGNYVMFPEDPLGRKGPKLDEFLRH